MEHVSRVEGWDSQDNTQASGTQRHGLHGYLSSKRMTASMTLWSAGITRIAGHGEEDLEGQGVSGDQQSQVLTLRRWVGADSHPRAVAPLQGLSSCFRFVELLVMGSTVMPASH